MLTPFNELVSNEWSCSAAEVSFSDVDLSVVTCSFVTNSAVLTVVGLFLTEMSVAVTVMGLSVAEKARMLAKRSGFRRSLFIGNVYILGTLVSDLAE